MKPKKFSHTPRGLVVFCDRNLRYEGGLKAWLVLAPVILGAVVLEAALSVHQGSAVRGILLWSSLLAYLLVFPPAWKSFLIFLRRKLVIAEVDEQTEPAAAKPPTPIVRANHHDERTDRAAA